MKNILFVASECVPFVKTGGLADVVGALPKSLDRSKYDVRVVPDYACIPTNFAASSATSIILVWISGSSAMFTWGS